jgi:hypothetical protein
LSVDDVAIVNTTANATIDNETVELSYDPETHIATFTFPGQFHDRLPDGDYDFTLLAPGVTDAAGNAMAANQLFQFTVDNPPMVVSSSFQNSPAPSVVIQFSEDVDASLTESDLSVVNTTTSATLLPADYTLSYVAATHTATFTFTAPLTNGHHTATLVASGVQDASLQAQETNEDVTFTIDNQPPVVATTGPYTIDEGDDVDLDASGSSDPDSGESIVSYEWDLDNDSIFTDATGAAPTITWAQLGAFGIDDDGLYTFHLRITNNLGVSTIGPVTLTIANVAPTIAPAGSATDDEGNAYALTLTAPFDPGDDTVANYIVHWGDSTSDTFSAAQIAISNIVTHVYNDNGVYSIAIDLVDEDATHADAGEHEVTINNLAPSSVTIIGPSSSPEGLLVHLTPTVVDPGSADTFTFEWNVTKDGNPFATSTDEDFDFTPDDNGTYEVTLTVTDDDDASTPAEPLVITVTDVDPSIVLTGSATMNEGAVYTLALGAITDPGTDGPVSLYRILWGDGSPAEVYSALDVQNAGGIFTHTFDDGPADRIITVRLGDEDGMHDAGTLAVHVHNLDPAGTFDSDGDVSLGESGFVAWLAVSDPSADDTENLVYDFDFNNDGTWDLIGSLTAHADIPAGYLTTLGTHSIKGRIRDNDGQLTDGAARDGIYEQTTTINVLDASLRVMTFTANSSGFAIRFNKSLDLNNLNLYDGDDASIDDADLAVFRAGDPGNSIPGSLLWDASTNTATWVATGGVMINDTYSVTLTSGASAFTAGGADHLDGNAALAGLENYSKNFIVNASTRSLSLPDFARGPGQTANLPLAGDIGAPITLSNPAGVTSVDFDLFYNPQLLDITAANLAPGVGGDWSLTPNFTSLSPTLRRLRISMIGSSELSALSSPMQIVRLTAIVPLAADYGVAQVLRIENVIVNAAAARGDYAIHSATYLGDVNHNAAYSGADSALIARVVAELDSGFDSDPRTDPAILADADANHLIQGQDASWVLQKSLLNSLREEIPDIPAEASAPVGSPPTPTDLTIDIPNLISANNGSAVLVPLSIPDSAEGLNGFNVTINYNPAILSLAAGSDSADISLAGIFTAAGGWTISSYVDQSLGVARLGFYRAQPMPDVAGDFATLNFNVAPDAPAGTAPITTGGLEHDGRFAFTHQSGSVNVVIIGPTVVSSEFVIGASGLSVQVSFSEDVSASLIGSDLLLTNMTTSDVIPAGAIAIIYDTQTNIATFTFPGLPGGLLPDGDYHLDIAKSAVTDTIGRPLLADGSLDFFFLSGDANRDRKVDIYDLRAYASHFSGAGDFATGDFNFDGVVDRADLQLLTINWQKILP